VTSEFFFGTTCKSNTVRKLATVVLFYNTVFLHFSIEITNQKQIHNFRKVQRAGCKASKSRMRLASRSLASPVLDFQKNVMLIYGFM